MLMPTLSVTAIGVLIAVVGIFLARPPKRALLHGLIGAWLGFLAGAALGVAIDVVLGEGVYLALFGHVAAAIADEAAMYVATNEDPDTARREIIAIARRFLTSLKSGA